MIGMMFKNMVSNWKKLIIGVVIFIIIIVGLMFLIDDDNILIGEIKNPDGVDFYNEYVELNGVVNEEGLTYPEVKISDDNKFEYSDSKEIIDIFNSKKDAVIYFGYAACVYCRSAIQVLYDVSKGTEIDKIYYLDVTKKDDKYDELVDILDDKFLNNSTEELDEIYAPLVLFVADGKVVSYKKDTVYSQIDPFDELDASQINGLSEIYRYGIRDVIDSINNKKKSDNEVS